MLEFPWQIFFNSSKTKFHEIPSSGSQVVPCRPKERWTARHDKTNSCFRDFANAPKKAWMKPM
jgi:hypothetical protein